MLFVALGSSGCFFDSGHSDGPRLGTLLVDWTVEGRHATAACRETGADTVNIAISTGHETLVDEFQELCETFEVSVDLLPGTYLIDATLLDANGVEITTTVTDRVFIDPGVVTTSAVDFPANSFF